MTSTGILLGLGAWVNRACVFGAIARLGSGEWAYAATPLGFFIGCRSVMLLFPRPAVQPLQAYPSPLDVAGFLAPLFILYLAWRMVRPLLALRGDTVPRMLAARIWRPHEATIVIGFCFVVTLLAVGRWAYTDVLADLARMGIGTPARIGLPVALFVALFAGAFLGGSTTGRWTLAPVAPSHILRCLCGGLLMGWGSLLIPGSNDGLILIGLPLLQPYAWCAFLGMCLAIAAAMTVQRAWCIVRRT